MMAQRETGLFCTHAAVRMRVIMPMLELKRLGHDTRVVHISTGDASPEVPLPATCDIAVIDRLIPIANESVDVEGRKILVLIERLREEGVKVVADVCDDHFGRDDYSIYYRELVDRVDAVTVNTGAMAAVVSQYTERPVYVIGDPFEGARGEPRFSFSRWRNFLRRKIPSPFHAPGARLKMTWFGHQSSLRAFFDVIETFIPLGKRLPLSVTLVSAPGFGGEDFCEIFNHYHGRYCRLKFMPWSLQNTWQALQDTDLVMIPADAKDRTKRIQSANRAIESLHAGRFVLAHGIPSYQELADYLWIGADLTAGLEWALAHSAQVEDRIRAGQDYIERHYSPRALARLWEQAFNHIYTA